MEKIKGLKYNKFSLSQPLVDLKDDGLNNEISFIEKHRLKRMFIRKRSILFIESCRYAKTATQNRWGINFAFLDYGNKGVVKQVFQTNNLNNQAAALWWERIQKNYKFTDEIVNELEDIIKIDKRIVSTLDLQDIKWKDDFSDFFDLYLSWFSQFFEIVYPWFAIDEMKNNVLEPWIRSKYNEQADGILSKIFKPKNFPLSSVEQIELLEISKMNEKEKKSALLKHKKKYDFLAVHQVEDQVFDLEYYEVRVKNLENYSEYKRSKENFKKSKHEIIEADELQEKLNFPKEYNSLLLLIRYFIYLRTQSIDHMMMVYRAFKKPFNDIAKRLNINLDELTFLTLFEIQEGLKRDLSLKEKAAKRMNNGYLYLIGSENSYLIEGEDGNKIFNKLEKLTDVHNVNKSVIKGVIAFKGKERGVARVVLDRRYADRVKEGEILVTTMTSPDFVPAMKRARAIITNEGGVLCHAAIMARELRKPCIISTKIATDLIKDGDMVEVDASKGIVKVIKK